MSAKGGFDRPILHGLCSKGFTARAIYDKFCNGDPHKVKKLATRFTSHVFPGETYEIKLWKENNGVIIYQTKTKERGQIAIKGFAELRN